ncbi:hypothetical protein GOP47_0025634 [Adiantum capillus-veneris]|uniref:Response regulatory domain-containing protein n=1 Tax=Adiantum capillus-veneris TaxID=13818 RepID=A0A9D4U0W6_ADICA|nr:hypothetical protein GOP47_0025634 [Adiantum capillus-veneris]
MKIDVSCTRREDDTDDTTKYERAGERQDELQQDIKKQAFQGSACTDQKGFRFLVKEVLKGYATTATSRALQQAVYKGVWQAHRHTQQEQKLQAQPQHSAVVRWERFLPHQQLHVLLVEDDDATRHIVGALLRNCSYEVTPASNGLLAWELLVDQNNQVDLVLTEVVMPCLSGIGLLGRIMNHGALKHIPVITMSSHDSVNVVFKCLSKGAVDFLVKPVRKNELKNLWQHVWRRCHSSSESSDSHSRNLPRLNDGTDLTECGTNEDSDKTVSDLNMGGGSSEGSGTQSTSVERALGAESGHQANKLHSTRLRTSLDLRPVAKPEANSSSRPEHWEDKDFDLRGEMIVAAAANAPFLDLVPSTHENSGTAGSVEDAHLAGHKGNACVLYGGITQRIVDSSGMIKEQDRDEEQYEARKDTDDLIEKHASNSPISKDKLSDSNSPPPLNSSNIIEPGLKGSSKEDGQVWGKGDRAVIHSSTSAFSRYDSRGNFSPLIDPATTHTPNVGFGNGLTQESGHGDVHTLSAIDTLRKDSVTLPNSDNTIAQSHLEANAEVECPAEVCPPAKHGVQSKEDTSLPPASDSFPASKQAAIVHAVYLGAGPQVGESGQTKDYCKKLRTGPMSPKPNDQTVTHIKDGAPRCGSSSNMVNSVEGNVDPSGSCNGHGRNGNGAGSNGSAIRSNIGSNGVHSATAVLPHRGKDLNSLVDEDNGLPDAIGVAGSTKNAILRRGSCPDQMQAEKKRKVF